MLDGRENLTLVGAGAGSVLRPSETARFGIEFRGANRAIRIANLAIVGVARPELRQSGIGTEISARVSGDFVIVEHCEVSHVAMGITFDAAEHGSWRRVTVRGNFVHDCVGVESHQGYGIVNSGGAYFAILDNFLERCERHSIYHGVGGPATIRGNTISDHRPGAEAGPQLSGLVVARSHDVIVADNVLDRCANGAMSIEPHETDPEIRSRNISVRGNLFRDSIHQDLFIGGQDPATSGPLGNVTVQGNTFYRSRDADGAIEAIRIHHGERLLVQGNILDGDCGYDRSYALVVASAAGGSRYTRSVTVSQNSAIVSTSEADGSFVEVGRRLTADGEVRLRVLDNDVVLHATDRSSAVRFESSESRGAVQVGENRVVIEPRPM